MTATDLSEDVEAGQSDDRPLADAGEGALVKVIVIRLHALVLDVIARVGITRSESRNIGSASHVLKRRNNDFVVTGQRSKPGKVTRYVQSREHSQVVSTLGA